MTTDPRIVIQTPSGLRSIIGTVSQLGPLASPSNLPDTVAWGEFRSGKLAKVEKTYVLYREVVPKNAEDDGA